MNMEGIIDKYIMERIMKVIMFIVFINLTARAPIYLAN